MDCSGNADCSARGICTRGGKCFCDPGWTGATCSQRSCPRGCSGHGQCNVQGKCDCEVGWTSADCSRRTLHPPLVAWGCCRHGSAESMGGQVRAIARALSVWTRRCYQTTARVKDFATMEPAFAISSTRVRTAQCRSALTFALAMGHVTPRAEHAPALPTGVVTTALRRSAQSTMVWNAAARVVGSARRRVVGHREVHTVPANLVTSLRTALTRNALRLAVDKVRV